MKHISILVPQGHTSLPNIDGTLQILSEVNTFRIRMRQPPLFKIQLVGLTKEISQRNGMYTIVPDCLISDIKKTDLIIIPAMHGDMATAMEENKAFIPWMIDQYKTGAELASFCIGTFFLAATGLLNGKQAATHWVAANEFRQMFPDVTLVDDKIITADDGIYTSGGAYSFLNLLIYLIEKYSGRETAIFISKAFMIDIDRQSQSPFIIFEGQKAHTDEPVKKAQEFIEKNFTEKISVDKIAEIVAVGRRNLERRFKKATSNTLAEYMQRVKVEAAKKSFENSRKNINEVMYEVGYNDTKAFRNVFKRITGMSPFDYRNKYNKEAFLN
ncbi:MAG: helix-turn-helix domain-containing protein [Ferruginibacter sp.]